MAHQLRGEADRVEEVHRGHIVRGRQDLLHVRRQQGSAQRREGRLRVRPDTPHQQPQRDVALLPARQGPSRREGGEVSSGSTILIVGQASQKTGLARVTRAMAGHLAGHFDVHVLGIDCFAGDTAGPWTLHVNDAAHDVYAEARLTALTDELRPAAIVLYNDIWVIARYFDPLRRAAHRPPVIGYVPLDGTIAQPWLLDTLAPLDALVLFTEFARKAVQPLSAHVIPHGLDAGAFFPTGRLEARKTLFPDRPDLWNEFLGLNAHRNQPRKRLALTPQGFAPFVTGKPPDVRLDLHCRRQDIDRDP